MQVPENELRRKTSVIISGWLVFFAMLIILIDALIILEKNSIYASIIALISSILSASSIYFGCYGTNLTAQKIDYSKIKSIFNMQALFGLGSLILTFISLFIYILS